MLHPDSTAYRVLAGLDIPERVYNARQTVGLIIQPRPRLGFLHPSAAQSRGTHIRGINDSSTIGCVDNHQVTEVSRTSAVLTGTLESILMPDSYTNSPSIQALSLATHSSSAPKSEGTRSPMSKVDIVSQESILPSNCQHALTGSESTTTTSSWRHILGSPGDCSADGFGSRRGTRQLKSSRRRQCRSVGDIEAAFQQIKERDAQGTLVCGSFARSRTWPCNNTRSISLTLANSEGFSSSSSFFDVSIDDPMLRRTHLITYDLGTFARSPEYDMESIEFTSTDHSHCFTTPSICDESGPSQTLQFRISPVINRASSGVFDKTYPARVGAADAQGLDLPHGANNLSFHMLHPLSTFTSKGEWITTAPPGQPSLILTMPTPAIPQSPIFVSQSPITVAKVFSAITRSPMLESRAQIPAQTLPPPLPSCGHCGLLEFETNSQCRSCDERWLACKVWYRANDGGRKRHLTEPYIRPAESTSRTRAVMNGLGIPSHLSDPEGNSKDEVGWRTKYCELLRVRTLKQSIRSLWPRRKKIPSGDVTDYTQKTISRLRRSAGLGLGRLLCKITTRADTWLSMLYKNSSDSVAISANLRTRLSRDRDLDLNTGENTQESSSSCHPEASRGPSSRFVEHLTEDFGRLPCGPPGEARSDRMIY